MVPMRKPPTATEVAYHEAGHIFAGCRFGRTFVSSEIHPEQATGKGETVWAEEISNTLTEGVVAAIGECAEAICKDRPCPRQFPPSLYGAVSDDEELGRKAAEAEAQVQGELRTVDQIIAGYFETAEMTCRTEGHWPVISEIADALEKDGQIDAAAVSKMFHSHGIPMGFSKQA